ncbi:predicted protein [Thalassiosira pseudonana CCMP1335]|uniref:Uncharacterized protein n=1 Tax=Thalassiosira pseudonana TaxID=35128 RepID=B8LEE4_THAPS|nr:predicted protein [Thalassiosira pseudonana CCMP1335]EED86299.1 predicted protein [Thalassiosira pseudonana CCMP1335]
MSPRASINPPSSSQSSCERLLEEWPSSKQTARTSPTTDNPAHTQLKVTFSEMSMCYMFQEDPFYQRTKSINRSEQKNSLREASSQARRIRKLISGFPGSDLEAVQFIVMAGVICEEDVIGLENLIMNKAQARLLKEYWQLSR